MKCNNCEEYIPYKDCITCKNSHSVCYDCISLEQFEDIIEKELELPSCNGCVDENDNLEEVRDGMIDELSDNLPEKYCPVCQFYENGKLYPDNLYPDLEEELKEDMKLLDEMEEINENMKNLSKKSGKIKYNYKKKVEERYEKRKEELDKTLKNLDRANNELLETMNRIFLITSKIIENSLEPLESDFESEED